MPPSRTVRPSGSVTSSVPRRSLEPNPKRQPNQARQVGKHRLDIVGSTEITSDMTAPSMMRLCVRARVGRLPQPSPDQSALRAPAPARRQITPRSIIVASALAKPVLSAASRLRHRTRHQRAPLSHSRSASQWIAATILKVTSGNAKNDRSSAAVVRARRRPLKVAASRGPSRSVSRMRSLTLLRRRRNPEMIAHRHLDKRRDVKRLVLRLPDSRRADVAGLHGST